MDPKTIRTRLQELAFLNSKATIWFKASSAKQQPSSNGSAPAAALDAGWEKLHYSGGLREYVQHLNRDNTPMHEPIFIQDEVGGDTTGTLTNCAPVWFGEDLCLKCIIYSPRHNFLQQASQCESRVDMSLHLPFVWCDAIVDVVCRWMG